jgi:hypothetical protein
MADCVPMTRRLADDRGRVVEIRRRDRDVASSAPRCQRRVVLGMIPFVTGAVGAFVVGVGMLWWIHWPARANRRIVAWRTGQGMCGACAYPLKDLHDTSDGCVFCPECGAAWDLRHRRRPG